jgi:hypothetical protein
MNDDFGEGYWDGFFSGMLSEKISKDGCYIATSVYGSYDCPEVWTLRRFRDFQLKKTAPGRAFVRFYYAVSPTLVRWFGGVGWLKRLTRRPLDRLVRRLRAEGVADTPYRDAPNCEKWGKPRCQDRKDKN